jgi:cytochrome c
VESKKAAVNQIAGTNGWKILKLIDLLLLLHYMSHLGSTSRLHVGFAKRGLKKWAKKPAITAQKHGGGIYEGQCAACIRERSMIDHMV